MFYLQRQGTKQYLAMFNVIDFAVHDEYPEETEVTDVIWGSDIAMCVVELDFD